MRQISLPTEVLDYIFSFLESDFVTLKACSLSHPFLSQIAERYLYATVNLQDDGFIGDTGLRMFEFNQLLLDRPRIGSYVRTVEVRIPHKYWFDVTDLAHISSILQKLSLVKKIALMQEDQCIDCFWENLPETFHQAFLKCLCLQSMKELSLVLVTNFPLSALKDCKTIKILNLKGWKHDPKLNVTGDTLVHPLPPIESLTLRGCERESLQEMLPWLEQRHIRSLTFEGGCALSAVLAHCSNYLTTLDLNIIDCSAESSYILTAGEVKNDDRVFSSSVTLSTLPHLEELTIYGILDFHCFPANVWTMTTSIPAIANLLKTSSSLKRVSLVLHCDLGYWEPPGCPISLVNWAPLVCLFTESSVSSFRLHIKTQDGDHCTEILTSFANCAELMKLVDKGVLVITPQIPSTSKH